MMKLVTPIDPGARGDMAVHTIRIESDAEWCLVEICSAATWARAPGRQLTYENLDGDTSAKLQIDDRCVRLNQSRRRSALRLTLQLATGEDRVSLRTEKSGSGGLRVTSAANARVNEQTADDRNSLYIVLLLDAALAEATGAVAGDPALTGPSTTPTP